MKVEVRKSGGPFCETCGATEVVELPTGFLERDILAVLEDANAALERDCVANFERAADGLREEVLDVLASSVEAHRVGLLEHFRRENAALADGVLAVVEPTAKRHRVLKRRWQRKLAAEVALAVDELKAQTRFG